MRQFISVVLAMGTLAFAGSTFACTVPASLTPDTNELIKWNNGWPISDAKCEFLVKNNLLLDVTTTQTVLSGASVGWASVRLVDKNNVASNQVKSQTYVDSAKPGMDVAASLVISSQRDAIEWLDFEQAAGEIAGHAKAAKTR
jgi:hypothetical protein